MALLKIIQQRLKFFVVFVLLTIIITNVLFYLIFKPKQSTDTEYFRICAMVDNVPKSIYLEDYQKIDDKLCDENLEYADNSEGNLYFLNLTLIQENSTFKEWQFKEFTGGVADPNIYQYQIAKNTMQIQPLWQQHGEYFSWFVSGCFAFFTAFVLTKGIFRYCLS